MYEYKPDYAAARERIDAFWEGAVVDRALTYIMFGRPEDECVELPPAPADPTAKRLDIDYRVEAAAARAHNTVYYADSMPVIQPSLGPATVAAWCGLGLAFDERNSWATHDLTAWPDDLSTVLTVDPDGFYLQKSLELTRALREVGRGKFITGIQEWLSPADILSAARGPEQFCFDLLECPDCVKQLSDRLSRDLLALYDMFYRMARDAGEPASNWLNLVADDRYLVIQNDVSALLSADMFDEFLLPYTRRECAALDRTMYHLDGLQALKDLDRLLEIPELDAIQWGPPPQHWDWHEWVDVYKRIQAAGKGFFFPVPVGDLHELPDSGIRPEGAWLLVEGVADEAQARDALRLVQKWT
jgi:hypothetical protein